MKEDLLQIPEDAVCPITQLAMEDPVVCCDGHSYEREAIQRWLAQGRRTSPKTNAVLDHTNVVPNINLRNMIEVLKERMPAIQREQMRQMRERQDLEGMIMKYAREQEKLARDAALSGRKIKSSSSCVGMWRPVQSMTTKRAYLSASAIGTKIYALGGSSDGPRDSIGRSNVTHLDSVESYDPAAGVWSVAPSMSVRRSRFAAVTIDNRVYALGGWDGKSPLASVEVFEAVTGKWKPITPLTIARQAHAAAVVDGIIYILGGIDCKSSVLSNVETYDPRIGKWSNVSSMVTERAYLAAAALDGFLHCFGGYDDGGFGEVGNHLATAERYDVRNGLWCPIPSMSHATVQGGRAELAGAVLGSSIYALGGDGVVGGVECFSTQTQTWSPISTMLMGRDAHAAVTLGEKIYVVGGLSFDDQWEIEPTALVECFDLGARQYIGHRLQL
eukprot:gnl/MRDRNA2_/MRDRNA2_49413_c0_seq1.p1 gnl/MRDRNA2_/MRDRNA2_49413_c0~~gnl/MRDRNA2_/MRDRNA2_49413_c0_seq1.p1  ORF type:complete len:444 (+),score=76.39 gnl/MRDRNA2_/MRDRNA2_49413_c0_seq1:113-1444(+)